MQTYDGCLQRFLYYILRSCRWRNCVEMGGALVDHTTYRTHTTTSTWYHMLVKRRHCLKTMIKLEPMHAMSVPSIYSARSMILVAGLGRAQAVMWNFVCMYFL